MYRKKIIISTAILIFMTSLFSMNYFAEKLKSKVQLEFLKWRKPKNIIERQLNEDLNFENNDKVTISIAATGDIMFHSPQIKGAYDPVTGTYDFFSTFKYIQKYIEEADIALGNFETVTAGPEHGFRGYPRFNAPKVTIKALKDTGFDILSTANNHCLDAGREGLIETIDAIKSYGLENIGTQKDSNQSILIKDIKGIKIAFLCYTYGCNGLESLITSDELNNMVNIISEEKIKKDIQLAKESNVDIITVFIHWGNEYLNEPTEEQISLANRMFQWGADIILGSHPHVIQKAETVNYEGEDKFVIYSMGNFVSNQRYETVQNKYTEDGIIVRIDLEKDLQKNRTVIKTVKYIPTWVYRYKMSDGRFRYEIIPIEDYLKDNQNQLDKQIIDRMIESYKRTMERIKQ